jgi:hypothetical protein
MSQRAEELAMRSVFMFARTDAGSRGGVPATTSLPLVLLYAYKIARPWSKCKQSVKRKYCEWGSIFTTVGVAITDMLRNRGIELLIVTRWTWDNCTVYTSGRVLPERNNGETRRGSQEDCYSTSVDSDD